MLDKIFATISMLGVIAFMGTVVWFVREPNLIVVTVVIIGIGVYYIWGELRENDSRTGNGPRDGKTGT